MKKPTWEEIAKVHRDASERRMEVILKQRKTIKELEEVIQSIRKSIYTLSKKISSK